MINDKLSFSIDFSIAVSSYSSYFLSFLGSLLDPLLLLYKDVL